jgi:hypothetical protein
MMSFWLHSVAFGITGVGFLVIGFRGLITKKPFLIPAHYPAWLMILVFLPGLISQAFRMSEQGQNSFNKSEMQILLGYAIVVTNICWQMIGYLAIGVTEEAMTRAIRDALQRLNLPYQESNKLFRLTTLSADLSSSFAGLPGVWRIKMKRHRFSPTLKDVVRLMNIRFGSVAGKVNLLAGVVYGILGGIFIVLALSIAYTTVKIKKSSVAAEQSLHPIPVCGLTPDSRDHPATPGERVVRRNMKL